MEVRELPPHDRPRERLVERGPGALSSEELMSVILGSGIKGKGVRKLAREVLSFLEARNFSCSVKELTTIEGLGQAKATLILAAFELARRYLAPPSTPITTPEIAYQFLRPYADKKQEHFLCLSLNGAQELIALRVVSVGLVNRALTHPREVFADPIADRAASIIVAHNHPSGSLTPSVEDQEVTRRLKEAGEILGIPLLDHIVFSQKGYLSLKQAGYL
ncbi:RadC family protein [Spirochaeta thermophila]|uniref:DNA repair protein RadC n=2 Tax=Winmispira thermophila TaxID=154 RepID=G0GBR5_WINT7|nr:DNA repair protein RadC [Spirochaeta thermophila]ADN02229.1 DNA repair protein RadC [Spirochaeta thermophila DSM 6192]AEJ61143.1 DNA repair protein RadC [Spirochaeta thermophila DSM 6578]